MKYSPKKEWGLPGGKLCAECFNEQDGADRHEKAEVKSVKYQGEHIRVIEIPITWTTDAWNKVDERIKEGYTIKGIIEREYWKTSLVILEKLRQVNHQIKVSLSAGSFFDVSNKAATA